MTNEKVEKSVANAPGRTLYVASALTSLVHPFREQRKVERILIFKLDHLGDLLIATPALRAIRARFPDAEIRIVVGDWNVALLRHNPSIDAVHVYNSARFCRPPNTTHRFSQLREQLGTWKPDLVVGLRDDWHTLGYALLSGAARVDRGSAHLVEYAERARTHQALRHEIERLWRTLEPLGIERETDPQLDYFVDDDERTEARRFMADRGIRAPFAMLHAGATQPLREWPLERFASIARHLHRRYGMQAVLVGVDRERERSRGLASLIQDLAPVDVTGELGLRPTAALMGEAGLYVGSDGGAMHLAAAVGAPTIGLFGPGSYHVFSPIGRRTVGITRMFPCSPCGQITCIRPQDTCMHAITTDEVLEAVDRLVGREELVKAGE
ncbi:MAG TPA: glycosyltransferase family 9 protein [Candidatus Kapabacteria bacterium]|jgi:ADP-heptose:LPS heptosyltransferase|nr:glycosyltransferase family 9 protein [Candidatus Kapabacteria bacterium]